MATQINFDKQGLQRLTGGLIKPLSRTREYFSDLGGLIDRQTQLTFRQMGRGPIRWPKLKASTIKTDRGTFKIRYGTDKSPKRTAEALKEYKTANNLWYKPGPMKGYEGQRRYSAQSKPLQASGFFRKSWRVLKLTGRSLMYGSNYNVGGKMIADKIQAHGRPVLFVLKQDEREYVDKFLRFWFKRMTF